MCPMYQSFRSLLIVTSSLRLSIRLSISSLVIQTTQDIPRIRQYMRWCCSPMIECLALGAVDKDWEAAYIYGCWLRSRLAKRVFIEANIRLACSILDKIAHFVDEGSEISHWKYLFHNLVLATVVCRPYCVLRSTMRSIMFWRCERLSASSTVSSAKRMLLRCCWF